MRFKGFRGWAAQKPDSHRGSTGRRDRVKWNGVWRALGAGQSEEMKNRSRAELHTENWAIYIFASDAAIYKGRGWKGWGKNKPEPIILESRKNTSIRCFFFFYYFFYLTPTHLSAHFSFSTPQFLLHRQQHPYFTLKWYLTTKRLLPICL